MTERIKEKLDNIISRAVSNEVSWECLFGAFDPSSPYMEEILFTLQERGIKVVDEVNSVEDLSTPDFTYIKMNVRKITDCLSEFRKYDDGDFFCDYLLGEKISSISLKNGLEKNAVKRRIVKFASYVSCWELEQKYLYLFLHYKLRMDECIEWLHLDVPTYRFLYARSVAIDKVEYGKFSLTDELKVVSKRLQKKDEGV